MPAQLTEKQVLRTDGNCEMKLSEAIDKYLLFARLKYAEETVVHYRKTLQKVIEHLDDPEVEGITQVDLQRYFYFLKTEYKPHRFLKPDQEPTVMSPAGLDGYWKAIRSFYSWAENALQTQRPDLAVPQPKYKLAEVKAFSQDEMKKLIYYSEWMNVTRGEGEKKQTYRMHRPGFERDVALLKFMFDTGLRIGELCRVKVGDVDLETGTVIVRPFGSGQKTKPRTVYLGNSTKQSLWRFLANHNHEKNELLFGLTEKSTRQLLHSIGTRSKVEDVHPQRFRHTFAIEFLRNNRDPFTLMRLLGHSTLDMSKHYLDILDTDLAHSHSDASPVDRNKL
jgi:integrase/recombinase XerD